MVDAQKFPYKIVDSRLGMVDRMPYLPLTLSFNSQSLNTEGLIETAKLLAVIFYTLQLQRAVHRDFFKGR
jgi:hypothetical protein